MIELEAVSDPVRLSYLQAVLGRAGVKTFVFESYAGAALGGAVPTRLMVSEADALRARAAIAAADPAALWR